MNKQTKFGAWLTAQKVEWDAKVEVLRGKAANDTFDTGLESSGAIDARNGGAAALQETADFANDNERENLSL